MKNNIKSGSKKKATAIIALLVALTLIFGTFMWYISIGETKNEIESNIQDVELIEDFDPGEKIEPGEEVKKDVKVANNGDTHVITRAMIEESVEKLRLDASNDFAVETDTDPNGVNIKTTTATPLPITLAQSQIDVLEAGGSGYSLVTAENPMAGVDVYLQDYKSQDGIRHASAIAFAANGSRHIVKASLLDEDDNVLTETTVASYTGEISVRLDGYTFYMRDVTVAPTVHKPVTAHGVNHGDIIMNFHANVDNSGTNTDPSSAAEEGWVYDAAADSGWYYYNTAIEPHEATKSFLESVSYNSNLDNTWQGSKYVIDVKYEATQFNQEAANDLFGATSTTGRLTIGTKFYDRCDVDGNGAYSKYIEIN